jgi:hypothetical protein
MRPMIDGPQVPDQRSSIQGREEAKASAIIDVAQLLYCRSSRETVDRITIDRIMDGEPMSIEHRG